MEKKDYFSSQSKTYAAFRPAYPPSLYRFIFEHLKSRSCAWDCATGNGQVALYLAHHFDTVYATDISQQQIDHAFPARNISYLISPAEQTAFGENQFDLITVGQALHWFNVDAFYNEVSRTAKANGLLAVWGYTLPRVTSQIDKLLMNFYENTVGPYWDPARKLVENEYRDIRFPFDPITCPQFTIRLKWPLHQFAGYLNSWSATQRYLQSNKINPVDEFVDSLKGIWSVEESREVTFPLFMKLGKIHP